MFVCECLGICVQTNDDGLFKLKAQTDLMNSVSENHLREKEKERERVRNREAMKINDLFIVTGV